MKIDGGLIPMPTGTRCGVFLLDCGHVIYLDPEAVANLLTAPSDIPMPPVVPCVYCTLDFHQQRFSTSVVTAVILR
jgi:hypothetical protein